MQRTDAQNPEPPSNDGWLDRPRGLMVVLAAATLVAVYLCYLLVAPFLPALAWALALAVIAHPLHRWLSARIANDTACALVSLALVTCLIIGPAIFVGFTLVGQATGKIQQLQETTGEDGLQAAIERNSRVAPALRWLEEHIDVSREVQRVAAIVAGKFSAAVTGTALMVGQLLFTLFTLFFFFRDHRLALRGVRSLLPLSHAETDDMFARVGDTIYATIYGSLTVALLQGALGGLMFWWLGLPAPLLWAVVMGLLAIVPYLGTFVIWGPAAAFLALQGDVTKAIILTAWGLLAIGLIDNLIYPWLVGKRLQMHPLLAFIAIIGGLAVFGASGVILGPVIFAVTEGLIHVWRRRTAGDRTAECGVDDPTPRPSAPVAAR